MTLPRTLMMLGGLLFGVGLLFFLGDKMGVRIGRLPGDIVWKGKNTTFYFPLATSVILSLVGSLLLWLLSRK
jgi:hypothetical protein